MLKDKRTLTKKLAISSIMSGGGFSINLFMGLINMGYSFTRNLVQLHLDSS